PTSATPKRTPHQKTRATTNAQPEPAEVVAPSPLRGEGSGVRGEQSTYPRSSTPSPVCLPRSASRGSRPRSDRAHGTSGSGAGRALSARPWCGTSGRPEFRAVLERSRAHGSTVSPVILRRLYLYVVSAAALTLLATGLTLLGGTILLFVFNDPSADSSRGQLAVFTAMTVVALPVWAVHFWFARRLALRDPFERASALRRLYFYWACL